MDFGFQGELGLMLMVMLDSTVDCFTLKVFKAHAKEYHNQATQ